MDKITDPMKFVADLKPSTFNQLAQEGYVRRRHDDLARVVAEAAGHAPAKQGRHNQFRLVQGHRRWPLLLTGGVAVTAAAAITALTFAGASPNSPTPAHPTAGVPHTTLDARTTLLSSAAIAEHGSAATGAYWYVRERDFEPTAPITKNATFGASYAATEESWYGPSRGRTITNEDLKFSFASAADEAKWKAAGEPALATPGGKFGSVKPYTSNYDMSFHWGVGKVMFTFNGVQKLPTTAATLGKLLQRAWNSEPDKAAVVGFPHPSYGQYLFTWAGAILTGPTTPGTRAAIYQLLAGQSGIKVLKGVTDPLGRTGIAVGDGAGDYLVIDPGTAKVLAATTYPLRSFTKIPSSFGGTEVTEAEGWTNQLGAPAQP
jgi:hypothetical protein